MNARDPLNLIFVELPQALEIELPGDSLNSAPDDSLRQPKNKVSEDFPVEYQESAKVQLFVSLLKKALDELRFSYTNLLNRLKDETISQFDSLKDFALARKEMASRSESLIVHIREPKLKAFCMRLFDENLAETEWLESIGSLILSKPPKQWLDSDEESFWGELASMIQRFKRVESTVFEKIKNPNALMAVRLGVTQIDGTENHEVVYCSQDDKISLSKIQKEIEKLIRENPRVGLFAVSQAILKTFSHKKETENEE